MQAPKNTGILDIQVYFPNYYIDQAELEQHDKVSQGKYTKGLGQSKMAVTTDREDINSVCLTVLDKLLTKNKIDRKNIGRLEVGTETFIDKSKSIKTCLMSFFEDNNDIEGVTTSNACYGGTNAFLNAINWIQSDYYDGRLAIVIIADIAVYAKGNARPTGGCGAMALLVGNNAPIVLEPYRCTYMNHVYDFYKPDPTKEYPTVDGGFSLDCYMKALESCYNGLISKNSSDKFDKNYTSGIGNKFEGYLRDLNDIDYFCFHCPFAKMVEKAFVNLVSYEIKRTNNYSKDDSEYDNSRSIYKLSLESQSLVNSITSTNKDSFKMNTEDHNSLKQILTKKNLLQTKVLPSLVINKNVGNTYTSSLYIGLLSIILNNDIDLTNKRVMMFSYGSGCAATLFTLKINKQYVNIKNSNSDVLSYLNNRIKISPIEFENIMVNKEKLYLRNDYKTNYDLSGIHEGTYYLSEVDNKWRRKYLKKGYENNSKITSHEYEASNNIIREISFNKLSNHYSIKRIKLIRNQLLN